MIQADLRYQFLQWDTNHVRGGKAIHHHSQSASLSSSARLWDTFRDFGTLSRFDFGTLFGPSINRDQWAKHNVNELLQSFSGQKVSRFLDTIQSCVLLCTLKRCSKFWVNVT